MKSFFCMSTIATLSLLYYSLKNRFVGLITYIKVKIIKLIYKSIKRFFFWHLLFIIVQQINNLSLKFIIMNEVKLYKALTKIDVVLKWLLKGGLSSIVFSTLLILFVFIIVKLYL